MKKSLIALAVLACAAGVASADQITITNLSNGGAGMSPMSVTSTVKSTQTSVDKRSTSLPGGGSGDITGMKTVGDGITKLTVVTHGGGSGGITSANGGGSSCLTAQAPPTHPLGTGSADPSDV